MRHALMILAAAGVFTVPVAAPVAQAQDSSMVEGTFSNDAGSRRYRVFDPGPPAGVRPLVVMLHGCTQDADDIARGTRMNEAAASRHWIVLYPSQPESAHPRKCWNWYDAAHQQRGAGEPAILAGLIEEVAQRYHADRTRIYLAGLSAGAAMASLLAAAYPESFAALALHSGLAHGAAATMTDALAAMQRGVADVDERARAAYEAMGERRRPIPTLVIHGQKDAAVAVKNGEQAAEQWARTNWMVQHGGEVPRLTPREMASRDGWHGRAWDAESVELRVVDDLGHAWSGGSPSGSYTDERPPRATDWIVAFFESHRQRR